MDEETKCGLIGFLFLAIAFVCLFLMVTEIVEIAKKSSGKAYMGAAPYALFAFMATVVAVCLIANAQIEFRVDHSVLNYRNNQAN